MTTKILHISDLHVAADPRLNAVIEQKIEFIRTHYPEHHYVVTGDLVDNEGSLLPGTNVPVRLEDPAFHLSAFVSPPPPIGPVGPHLQLARRGMQNAFSILSRLPLNRVYICPGNHDFGLWGNVYAREFADAFDELLWRPINGGKAVTQLGVLDNPFQLPGLNARTPVMFTIADGATSVQLILLNSNVDSAQPGASVGTWASGSIGEGQLDKLRRFLTAELLSPFDPGPLRKQLGIVRIAAFHHHPWFTSFSHCIKDSDALLGVLRRTTDLVMFGHKHVQKRYDANTFEAAQFTYGGLASGWIRSEATAAQIVVDTVNSVTISYVPIT